MRKIGGTSFGVFLPENEGCMRTVKESGCACSETAPVRGMSDWK